MTDKENEPDEIISIDAVREFLVKNKGKVQQADLVNNFRHQLSSPATKVRARQEFKDILQLITAVKTENGEKFIVLIKQQQEHFQASVISRKANRPLSVRKELAKSKIDYARTHDGSDEEDNIPHHHGSASTIASQDSGVASETSSQHSVSAPRSALSDKMKESQSMDSIDTYMAEGEDDDLEDEIGLNDGAVVLPEEKEWMLAAAHGKIDALKKLLEKHPELARKKDFVMVSSLFLVINYLNNSKF
ncbi:uncharacterized protein LOC130614616 [Hydractinia symbiolongicarpus]|uniref:uncharacterized protein LOC130614616 n=1 Tax=Hydractinia symbiolongicarpus TaxID=13093 RepID=UPI0025515BEA|nr:uncharacterized protein LOC130614616 [Hydractinia symbiolongicarpus]